MEKSTNDNPSDHNNATDPKSPITQQELEKMVDSMSDREYNPGKGYNG